MSVKWVVAGVVMLAGFFLVRRAHAAEAKRKPGLSDDPAFQASLMGRPPKQKKCGAQTAQAAAGWVATGASVGSIVPGIGTAVGAGVGTGVFVVTDPCVGGAISRAAQSTAGAVTSNVRGIEHAIKRIF